MRFDRRHATAATLRFLYRRLAYDPTYLPGVRWWFEKLPAPERKAAVEKLRKAS